MSVLQHHNYRHFLQEVLAAGIQANPAFSLRAFAKKLGLAPSFLSALLRGQKALSPERAAELSARLNLAGSECEYFCLLVQLEAVESPQLKESLLKQAQAISPQAAAPDLSLDHFRIISDWHHFAILSALELEGVDGTSHALAKQLGIAKVEADLALQRLERMEMVEQSGGRFHPTHNNPRVVAHSPNQALRNFHKQTLQKAIESLETQTPKEKVIGSETLAIGEEQVDEFRALADRFFDEAVALAQKARKKDQVYHLGIQFFRLTNRGERK